MGVFSPSPDGQKVAYSLKEDNADEAVLYVMDLKTGESSDRIEGAKYAWPSWLPDSSGFYYTYLPTDPSIPTDERPGYADVRLHVLGTPSSEDPVVHPNTGSPQTFIGPSVSRDGRWLFVTIHHGWNRDDVFRMDLQAEKPVFEPFAVDFPAHFEITTHDGFHYVLTDMDAPRKKLVRTPVDSPSMENWQTVIPHHEENVLEDIHIVGDRVLASHLVKASSSLTLFELDGNNAKSVELPGIGTVRNLRASRASTRAFFEFSSFTTPPVILELNVENARTQVWKEVKSPVDMSQYTVKQVFFLQGWDTNLHVHRSSHVHRVEWNDSPALVRIWWLQREPAPLLRVNLRPLAGGWRCIRHPQSSRGRRIRRGVAQSGNAWKEAECVRRLHRGRRVPY